MIYGDGKQTRDFVHVSDVVCANLLICEREEAIGQTLNLASGRQVSLLALVDMLNDLLGARITPKFRAERQGDIRHSVGSEERMVALIGYRVQKSLREGLSQLITQTLITEV